MNEPTRQSPQGKDAAKPRDYLFIWEGKDKTGKIVRGEVRATTDKVAEAILRRQGVLVISLKKQKTSRLRKVSQNDVALFTRQLATMLRSGVPILQAFDICSKTASNPGVARLLGQIRADVETGTSLAAAFRKHPVQFDDLYCSLVAAGEQAGILDSLLDRLATHKEKLQALKSKVRKALFYPAAVSVVAAIVVVVMMLFVIPQFKKVFASFGSDLPAPTQIVITLSDFFVANAIWIFGVTGALAFAAISIFKRSPALQAWFDTVMLRIPVFGPLLEKGAVARWTRTLSTMFAAGVPLVEALSSVGGASGNHVFREATRKVQSDVTTGISLTVATQSARVFPTMMIQMIAIGEESGQLDSMLTRVADYFDQEVDSMVNGLSQLMEPLIMVVLGGLIGGLVIAMYLPIFKMGSVV